MSLAVFGAPVPYITLQCYGGNCSSEMVALVVCSVKNMGMELVVIYVLG